MLSDGLFKSCNDETVRLISAAGVPTYMYVLDRVPPSDYATIYSGKTGNRFAPISFQKKYKMY